ncbi:YcxB family protein [Psychrobacter sp. HD31]|uniref:YcxB family protein n=1 Tax=Psychrobacter sp. HD31 TaxID=3112003 RepID=UPI003DA4FBBC
MALYPYTLQPVALNMSEAEFEKAQMALFDKSSQSFGLSNIKMKEWIIMAIITALALGGLYYVTGYSTALFWVMLAGVVLYIAIRTLGMKWYVKREFNKQMAEQDMPEEMKQVKLGVQKQGLVMSMPAPQQNMSKSMRGMQMRMPNNQQAVIPWNAVTGWDETDEFMFIMFEMRGQKGSQIIPKRMQAQNLPIDTIKKHVLEVVPTKGIQAVEMS